MNGITRRTLLAAAAAFALPAGAAPAPASGSGSDEGKSSFLSLEEMQAIINKQLEVREPLIFSFLIGRPEDSEALVSAVINGLRAPIDLPAEPEFDPKSHSKARKTREMYNQLTTYYGNGLRGKITKVVVAFQQTELSRKYSRLRKGIDLLESSQVQDMLKSAHAAGLGMSLLHNQLQDYRKGKAFGYAKQGKYSPTSSEMLASTGLTRLVTKNWTMEPALANSLRVVDNILEQCNSDSVKALQEAVTPIRTALVAAATACEEAKAAIKAKKCGDKHIKELMARDLAILSNANETLDKIVKAAIDDFSERKSGVWCPYDILRGVPIEDAVKNISSGKTGPNYYRIFLRGLHALKETCRNADAERKRLPHPQEKGEEYLPMRWQ